MPYQGRIREVPTANNEVDVHLDLGLRQRATRESRRAHKHDWLAGKDLKVRDLLRVSLLKAWLHALGFRVQGPEDPGTKTTGAKPSKSTQRL